MTRLTALEDLIAADALGAEYRALVQQLENAAATLDGAAPDHGDPAAQEHLRAACAAALRVVKALRIRYRGLP